MVSLGRRGFRRIDSDEMEGTRLKCVILKRRITTAGHYRVRFAGVAPATDFGGKRPPLLWTWDGGDLGVLEIVSGTRPCEGSVCGLLVQLLCGGQEGQQADTDAALGDFCVADVSFDDDGRRTVKLDYEQSGREAVIRNSIE